MYTYCTHAGPRHAGLSSVAAATLHDHCMAARPYHDYSILWAT